MLGVPRTRLPVSIIKVSTALDPRGAVSRLLRRGEGENVAAERLPSAGSPLEASSAVATEEAALAAAALQHSREPLATSGVLRPETLDRIEALLVERREGDFVRGLFAPKDMPYIRQRLSELAEWL